MPKLPKAPPAEDRGRREALKALGRFAIYATPAMTVLIRGAEAHHLPGHCRAGPPGEKQCFSDA
jgi:hypothetical protein